MDVFIENATTFHVFDFFSVMEYNEQTSTSTVVVEYISEINYPWIIDTDTYEFVSTEYTFTFVPCYCSEPLCVVFPPPTLFLFCFVFVVMNE